MKVATPPSTSNVSLQASGTLLRAFYSYPQLYVTWFTSTPTATNGINILQITDLNGVTANIQFPTLGVTAATAEVVIPLVCKSLSVIQDANA
jgi:hypothetical protein